MHRAEHINGRLLLNVACGCGSAVIFPHIQIGSSILCTITSCFYLTVILLCTGVFSPRKASCTNILYQLLGIIADRLA